MTEHHIDCRTFKGLHTPTILFRVLCVIATVAALPLAAGAITLSNPTGRAIYQRNDSNLANVVIAGTFSGTADRVEARAVVRAGYGGTSTDWTTISAAPTGGAFSATLPVTGGWYDLEVRTVASGIQVENASVQRVGVGEVFVTAGQSNSACFGNPVQHPDDDRVSAYNLTTGSWQVANDPQPGANGSDWGIGSGGSCWPQMGDLLAVKYNVPIGIVAVGVGGSSITDWQAGRTDGENIHKAVAALSGTAGLRAVLWHQGETDATRGIPTEVYTSILNGIIAQSRIDAGFDIPWGVALASWNSTATAGHIAAVVAAQQAVIDADPLAFLGSQTNDFHNLNYCWDDVHFNQAGLDAHSLQWANAIDVAGIIPVPEPGVGALLASGLIVAFWHTSRRGRRYAFGQSLGLGAGQIHQQQATLTIELEVNDGS